MWCFSSPKLQWLLRKVMRILDLHHWVSGKWVSNWWFHLECQNISNHISATGPGHHLPPSIHWEFHSKTSQPWGLPMSAAGTLLGQVLYPGDDLGLQVQSWIRGSMTGLSTCESLHMGPGWVRTGRPCGIRSMVLGYCEKRMEARRRKGTTEECDFSLFILFTKEAKGE